MPGCAVTTADGPPQLAQVDFGQPLHSLVLVGETDAIEEEACPMSCSCGCVLLRTCADADHVWRHRRHAACFGRRFALHAYIGSYADNHHI